MEFCDNGNHQQEDLAKFDYESWKKYKSFISLTTKYKELVILNPFFRK